MIGVCLFKRVLHCKITKKLSYLYYAADIINRPSQFGACFLSLKFLRSRNKRSFVESMVCLFA